MEKINEMEERFNAYSTMLASNVDDYCGSVARLIATGSGQLNRGILWCGAVTVDILKWGYQFLSNRIGAAKNFNVSADTLNRIRWVKRLTKMSEIVAAESLSGVVKVSGFFTSSVMNSTAGKIFSSLLPGEIVCVALDGFNKVYDTIEVAGKNVTLTTSVVTTGLVSERYGEQAGKATNEGLDAAGYAFATAWTVFKITKAFNPNSAFKSIVLGKAAAAKASAEKQKAEIND